MTLPDSVLDLNRLTGRIEITALENPIIEKAAPICTFLTVKTLIPKNYRVYIYIYNIKSVYSCIKYMPKNLNLHCHVRYENIIIINRIECIAIYIISLNKDNCKM
jgi:hypothetical protein